MSIIVTDPPPTGDEYKYSYDIEDPSTGDTKSQHEVRRGDVVSGAYSVVDPDGTRRTVKYSADPTHGFTAFIHNEPVLPKSAQYQDIHQVTKQPLRPVAYGLYPKTNYEAPTFFFTPANEINSEREIFAQGQYFKPNAVKRLIQLV
ncbi:hypothetical protein MSG28_011886 [Choristoneura fumiferana]|uniref:Uncharacterized protein n=2 Tax=Choristoneura fumiferana TaxID=7141 RepID=A0ACC0KMQ5_CHOFU|nr:hypothetical protein MSG28_011886 [Choristoneura fumiferana]